MKIEYDRVKAVANSKKHGVSFEEAEAVLFDPLAMCMEDPDAKSERRWVVIGMSEQLRLLTVVYTVRQDRIRIISARKSTRREAKYYA